MEKLGLILCSTISKTEQILSDEIVNYITLSTNFTNEEVKSGEMNLTDYFAKVDAEGEVPKTSQPSTGEIINVIEQAIPKYENIIIVTISELLSGTHQNVVLALDSFDEATKSKVAIVNSNCIAMTETLVYDMIQEKKDELAFTELVEYLRDYTLKFKTYAVPGSLKFLKLSGRVNTSQLLIGALVNIKTLIKADHKTVDLFHKGRGYKSVFKKLDEELTLYKPSLVYYTSILEDSKVHSAMMDLFAKHNVKVVETNEADIVAGTHFGPGSFGFSIVAENPQA